jgi:hypothetical protein
MLWLKGWLETRFRFCFALVFLAPLLAVAHAVPATPAAAGARLPIFAVIIFTNPTFIVVACAFLAGAGIATQPSFQAVKGVHGSILFTLSLPVSRLRLLAVRAFIGWLEAVCAIGLFCCALWLATPTLRAVATATEMFEYAGTMMVCASALYFLSVLLGTFLDDQWRVWGTMLGSAGLWWLTSRSFVPASADIFRAMGADSPLIAHTVPWTPMAFSLGLCAILFCAALRIVQTREY